MQTYLVFFEFKNGYDFRGEFIAKNPDDALDDAWRFVKNAAQKWWWYINIEGAVVSTKQV